MNNSKWLWVIAVVVVVILGFSLLGNKDGLTNKDQVSTTTEKVSVNTQKKNSIVTKTTPKPETFTNVFPQRGNYECFYEEVTPTKRTSNVIYFSDGKMRGEFRELGGPSNIMVYDGYTLYTWTEGQSTGIASVPKSIADFPAIVPKDIAIGKVLGSGLNNVSWDCHAWSKDASLLAKPTYVKFY